MDQKKGRDVVCRVVKELACRSEVIFIVKLARTCSDRRFGKCYIRFDWIGEEGRKVRLQCPICLVCLEDGSSVRIV